MPEFMLTDISLFKVNVSEQILRKWEKKFRKMDGTKSDSSIYIIVKNAGSLL